MADTFDDLGIAPELVSGVEELEWDAPTALQRDAVPMIRRSNNVVLHGSTGAGVVGAYGLGLLDRLLDREDDARPRALVLVSDGHAASDTAASLARLGLPAGLSARALAVGWSDRPADILVATPVAAVASVRSSSLKLDPLAALVIDGADRLRDTGQWEAVETLVGYAPAGAQKIVVTGRFDADFDSFLERHVRKALTIPPRPVEEAGAPPSKRVDSSAEPTEPLRFAVAAEYEKAAAVLRLATPMEEPEVAVVCRTHDRAARMAAALAARGLTVDGQPDAGATPGDAGDEPPQRILVLPRLEADQRSTRAAVISCDVPFDEEALAALHGRGGAVVVTPGEIPHLRRIARRAGFKLQPLPLPSGAALTPAESVRDRLRKSLAEDDLAADLALLEPLLQEFTAAEIAAAALHLARQRATADAAEAASTRSSEAAAPATAAAPTASAAAPPPSTPWVRLFITAGKRDGVGPGDLVGAITGETGLEGGKVGKIDVRESHSTVEVPRDVAQRIIDALNGRSLRGRSLRVDYDRPGRSGGAGQRGRPAGGGRSPGPGSGGRSQRPGSGGRSPRPGPGGRPGGRPGGQPGGRPPGSSGHS